MRKAVLSVLFAPLFSTFLFGAEYYWGVSTDTPTNQSTKFETELLLGTRKISADAMLVTDEQISLAGNKKVKYRTYIFDLKNKVVTVKADGQVTGGGIVRAATIENGEVINLKYDYSVTKGHAYSYSGEDQLIYANPLPGQKVNREKGLVTYDGGASTFEVTYVPISKREYKKLKKDIESYR